MTDLSSGWDINGWGYMTDGTDLIWFSFTEWHVDWVADLEGEDLPADTHYGYDLGVYIRSVRFDKCLFGAQGDIETFLSTAKSWNQAGAFTLKIKTSSAPSYFKIDGDNVTLTVLWEQIRDIRKIANGDVQKYAIELIKFKQSG